MKELFDYKILGEDILINNNYDNFYEYELEILLNQVYKYNLINYKRRANGKV